MQLRDRIVEFTRIKASELIPDPANWRLHPTHQKRAYQKLVESVGIAGAALARRNEAGDLVLIDGHMRADLHGDAMLPVLVTDLTEAEAKVLLASFHGLGMMAQHDEVKLKALLNESEVCRDISDFLTKHFKLEPPESADFNVERIKPVYAVIINCTDETQQRQVIRGLSDAGVQSRAVIGGVLPKKKREPKPLPTDIATGEIRFSASVAIVRSERVTQLEGIFDVPIATESTRSWIIKADLTERPWSLGLIVGPSGSGKSTLARHLFPNSLVAGHSWSGDRAVVDDFPVEMTMTEITELLSSVGFSSPPAWLRPFRALSNGEQFRVTLARTIAERPELAVVDEFTSVVDRQVARIGSAALAKAVRNSGRRFVAVTCHADVEDWLQPDWKIDMGSNGEFAWRLLRRRPAISFSVRRVGAELWDRFRQHHYLSASLHKQARCFVGLADGAIATFTAVIHNPKRGNRGFFREHRTVCLPDFQGVGLGNAASAIVASAFAGAGHEYRSITTHPGMIQSRLRSSDWQLTRNIEILAGGNAHSQIAHTWDRATASFRWVGRADRDAAEVLRIAKH